MTTHYPKPGRLTASRSLAIAIFLTALTVLTGCGGGSKQASKTVASTTSTTLSPQQIADAEKDPSKLAALLDKNSTFFAVLINAAQQPVVGVVREDLDKSSPDSSDVHNFVIDYHTKKFSDESASYDKYLGTTTYRCVKGDQYTTRDNGKNWRPSSAKEKGTEVDPCAFNSGVTAWANDGFNTGGLTAIQANQFVNNLESRNFISVDDLKVVDRNGKHYLRFAVTVTPTKVKDGTYWGMQNFMFAFKTTGLDPAAHPYEYSGAGGAGKKIIYYVDPATQLPAYSETLATPTLDKKGNPEAVDSVQRVRVEYQFGVSVPVPSLQDPLRQLNITWPAEL